jgi:APA family basic amino acid/polyamine antiporter
MPPPGPTDLPRKLGLLDTASFIIGSVIGGGIFLVPSVIARSLPSPAAILAVWLFAGVLSFFGALAYAELGAMMPATGGQYVFLRETYGPLPAFLSAWTLFLIIIGAQISSLAIGFSIYLAHFVPLSPAVSKAAAVTLIALITLLNYRGTQSSARVQKTLLFLKLAGIAILIGGAFLSRQPSQLHFDGFAGAGWGQIGYAMVPCLLAYDGWNIVSFIAGEVKSPRRNIPLALGLSLALIAAIYVLLNAAFLKVLTVPEMAAAGRVGSIVAERTLGSAGAAIVALTILFSIAGSLNGALMMPPRAYFAQARDGLFFAKFGEVHPRFLTPAFSILIQGVWGILLAITGTYEKLVAFAVFAAWIFYAMTVTGVIVLRLREPQRERPYKMWGYPVTTLAFLAVAIWFIGNTVYQSPVTSVIGILFIAAGAPVYWLWKSRLNRG